MLSERDIELAHPEAFDFAFGNLSDEAVSEFNEHLGGCSHCQSVVAEYTEIGRVIQNLPPHVEPPAGLEDRTVAAMLRALTGEPAKADQPAETDQPVHDEDLAATRAYELPPRPPPPAAGATATSAQEGPATGTALPLWRRHRTRLAAIGVAAAAVIVILAVIVIVRPGGGSSTLPQAVDIPLHATLAAKERGYGAAAGRATARQDASGSWDITLTVQHLKHFDPEPWYGCWYVSRDGRQVASAGTFLVRGSGSETFHMTSAVDPHDFSEMEITLQPPTKTGARAGTVILIGQKP
jgi:hypothetical protein